MTDQGLDQIFPGTSEMATRMRALDWSATELGAPAAWPANLRTAVGMLLLSPVPMHVCWGPQRTMLYNDAHIALLGERHPGVLARSARGVFERVEPVVARVFEQGVAARAENVAIVLARDGERVETRATFSLSPIFGEGGVEGVFATVLETAARTATWLANLGRDLGGPLTLLLGPIEALLAETGDVVDAPRDQLDLVYRSALRVRKLVGALVELARVQAGRLQPTFQPVDLATLTREVAGAFRPTIEAGGLALELDAGPLAGPAYVDPHLWETILLQLLSNALKFTLEGSIRVTLRESGDTVRLEVADTGVGIDPARLPALFEPFRAVEAARARSHRGAGVGLAIVRELAALHGAHVSVSSTPGHGARFVVALPRGWHHLPAERVQHAPGVFTPLAAAPFLAEAAGWRTGSDLAPAPGPAPHADTGRIRVVVAEDDPELRDFIAHSIAVAVDVAVEAVASAADAVARIKQDPPDVVIAGSELAAAVTAAVRADSALRDTPVLAVGDEDEPPARGAPAATDRLARPFTGAELRGRVRLLVELVRARRLAGLARASSDAKDELLSVLGHELLIPLAPIATTIEVLRMRGGSAELDMLDRQVKALTRMVDDVLDFARLSRGKLQLHAHRVELAQVIDRAMERVTPLFDLRANQVFVRVPRIGLSIVIDPDRIAQVLTSVLTHAAKVSDPASRISIEASRVGDSARLVIRDESREVPPELAGDAVDATASGAGLALTLARGIVELHGGHITAHAGSNGMGTEIEIELPSQAVEETASTPPARRAQAGARKRVMIVEDNNDTACALKAALEELGYVVALAHNGPVALNVARSFKPDVALVDIGLPVMDGYELARRLREMRVTSHELHFVAVTAYNSDSDRQKSAAAGFVEHLVKPVDLRKLEQLVEQL